MGMSPYYPSAKVKENPISVFCMTNPVNDFVLRSGFGPRQSLKTETQPTPPSRSEAENLVQRFVRENGFGPSPKR
jgi:hypothetical protein